MDTTRQLLLALLAVHRGLIDHARVVAAWTDPGGQGGSLADRLERQGWLSPQTRRELEAEVLRQLPSAPTLPLTTPADTDDARKALAFLAGAFDEPPADGCAEDGRYRRTELHARGGVGLVWRARDGQLGRLVALKELQPEFGDKPTLRARFLAEARITGQLEHPGIVPVYEVIERPGDAPCYAMRLVHGRTLSEAVREFHARHARAARLDLVALRDLLGAFVSMCNTLAYAHSRGVVHRDLKGANVVLGPYGEVVVLDWGLAKVLGDADVAEPAVTPLPSGDLEATEQGRVGGTLAYMAPEQALGQVDRIDRRTDVFGLGAVLYEILTGRPPYGGTAKDEVLRRAQQGAVSPPRQLTPLAPRPLDAVCLKALAARPEDRYQTAAELAAEVKRWLAGEPVAAWPEPWAVKAGRWVRKHRVLAAATAAGLVVAVVLGATSGISWQQRRRYARERAWQGIAHATQLRQQYRWDDARKALDQVSGWLGQARDDRLRARLDEEWAGVELARDLDRVRLEAGTTLENGKWRPERARDVYPEVLARHGFDVLGGDAEATARRIRASAVRGNILAALDNWAYYERADRLRRVVELANLADDDPWRRYVRRAVADGNEKLARELIGRANEGRPTAGVAVMALRVSRPRRVEEVTALLRRMLHEEPGEYWTSFVLGELLAEQQKHAEAAACYLHCTALRPGSGVAHYNLGVALYLTDDLRGAIAAFRRAIERDPGCAEAHCLLGHALRKDKDPDGAIAAFRRAIACDPTSAEAHAALGDALYKAGDVRGANAAWRKAIEQDPRGSKIHTDLGVALFKTGEVDGALVAFRRAIAADPRCGPAHYHLGRALLAVNDPRGAVAAFRDAIECDPLDAAAHCRLGLALQDQGQFVAALVHLKKGDELGSRQREWAYPSARWVAQCEAMIALDSKLAAVLEGQVPPGDADELLALARLCLFHKKRPASAARFYRDAFAAKPGLADSLRPRHRYDAACAAALAGTGQGLDADRLDAADRADLRYTALGWIRDELSAHARELAGWREDASLAAVRDRDQLAGLPEAEQVAWSQLWAQVDALLVRGKPGR